jgi:hypothetical protein
MFELIYDIEYSNREREYYDIYKDGKPYYKNKNANFILSLAIYRYSKTMKFINVIGKRINELLFDRHELYLLILSLYDELDIEGYRVIGNDLMSKELGCVLKDAVEKRD